MTHLNVSALCINRVAIYNKVSAQHGLNLAGGLTATGQGAHH